MSYLWKIGGEAGFGIMTAGVVISKIAARSGYHIFDYAEYPSLIRGGHNTYEVLISDEETHATKHSVDMLVCLNEVTYTLHKDRLTHDAVVVYDPDVFQIADSVTKVELPMKKILSDLKGPFLMTNTISLGASLALMGGDLNVLYGIIEEQFGRKGQEIVDYNKQFAKAGFDHVSQNHHDKIKPVLPKRTDKEKLVLTANEAFSIGAVAADCRLYSAYPMTPTSNVLSILAGWQSTTGMIVRHAEDEISVVNTALGASHGGVRASVGTSGGGFALMVETISYAGIAEIPLVIFLGQRPGPATGMPTWTEQGDLLFAAHAGHGEFPKIVLASGDISEMTELTIKAFDLADVYQIPVVIMGDKLICESHKSIYREDISNMMANYHPNRGQTITTPESMPYLRYKVTDDGVSPRLIPGAPGTYYQANSYEHIEDSHTTEDAQPRIDQVNKRARKWQTYVANHFALPKLYGDAAAETVFVSWGGNKGPILEAQRELAVQGIKTGYLHFTHMYPLDREKVRALFQQGKKYILIENNSQGQFGKLLEGETGVHLEERLLRYDGRPLSREQIVEYITKKNASVKI